MVTTQVFKLSESFPDFTLSPERPHLLSLSKQHHYLGTKCPKAGDGWWCLPLTPPQFFLLVVLPWWKTLKTLFLYGMLPTVTSFPLWTCGLWIQLQLQQWFMVHVLFCRKFRSIIYASDHFKGIRSYPRIIFLFLPACFLLKIIHHLQINK